MIYPITYPSALFFWSNYSGNLKDIKPVSSKLLRSAADNSDKPFYLSETLRFAHENNIELPVHVFTDIPSHRHLGSGLTGHVAPRYLPENSIVELPGPIYIISPELCFVLASQKLPLPELAKAGYDLCAIYVEDPEAEYLQRSRTPITNTAKLGQYINTASGIGGVVNARKAIQYICDNSNSPMETKLVFIGRLPFHLGGYNLPEPVMNALIHLVSEGARILGYDTCKGDIVWLPALVDLEYDSNLSHLSPEQHAIDKKRTTALSLSGYTVITATATQFHNCSDIDALFITIRKALGLKPRNELLNKYKEIRWQMLKQVFKTNLGQK